MEKIESSMGRRSAPGKGTGSLLFEKSSSGTELSASSQRLVEAVARQNLASAIEHHGSGRKSLSEFSVIEPNPVSSNLSLRKQFHNEEEHKMAVKMPKGSEDDNPSLQVDCRSLQLFPISTTLLSLMLPRYWYAILTSFWMIS